MIYDDMNVFCIALTSFIYFSLVELVGANKDNAKKGNRGLRLALHRGWKKYETLG